MWSALQLLLRSCKQQENEHATGSTFAITSTASSKRLNMRPVLHFLSHPLQAAREGGFTISTAIPVSIVSYKTGRATGQEECLIVAGDGQPYTCIGLARTICIRCVFTVFLWYFWQGNHHIYGHIRCIYAVLANPKHAGMDKGSQNATLADNFEVQHWDVRGTDCKIPEYTVCCS